MHDFEDIKVPKDDMLDVNLDIEEIDFKIQENELSGLTSKSNW